MQEIKPGLIISQIYNAKNKQISIHEVTRFRVGTPIGNPEQSFIKLREMRERGERESLFFR